MHIIGNILALRLNQLSRAPIMWSLFAILLVIGLIYLVFTGPELRRLSARSGTPYGTIDGNFTYRADVHKALEKVHELVMRKLGWRAAQNAEGKAPVDGARTKDKATRAGEELEGKWMITVSEVAKLLGVSRSKMYTLVASRQVPSVTIGSSRRIPLKVFRDWVGTMSKEG